MNSDTYYSIGHMDGLLDISQEEAEEFVNGLGEEEAKEYLTGLRDGLAELNSEVPN